MFQTPPPCSKGQSTAKRKSNGKFSIRDTPSAFERHTPASNRAAAPSSLHHVASNSKQGNGSNSLRDLLTAHQQPQSAAFPKTPNTTPAASEAAHLAPAKAATGAAAAQHTANACQALHHSAAAAAPTKAVASSSTQLHHQLQQQQQHLQQSTESATTPIQIASEGGQPVSGPLDISQESVQEDPVIQQPTTAHQEQQPAGFVSNTQAAVLATTPVSIRQLLSTPAPQSHPAQRPAVLNSHSTPGCAPSAPAGASPAKDPLSVLSQQRSRQQHFLSGLPAQSDVTPLPLISQRGSRGGYGSSATLNGRMQGILQRQKLQQERFAKGAPSSSGNLSTVVQQCRTVGCAIDRADLLMVLSACQLVLSASRCPAVPCTS